MSGRSDGSLFAAVEEARGEEAEGRAGPAEGKTGGGVPAATGCLPAQPAAANAAQQIRMNTPGCSLTAARLMVTLRPSYAELSLLLASRAARRSSSQLAAFVSFSETSRRNCAVCSSVFGARSSSTNRRSRPSSSSSLRPTSSNLSMSSPALLALPKLNRNSGIIETRKLARKEAHCRFPTSGGDGWTAGSKLQD